MAHRVSDIELHLVQDWHIQGIALDLDNTIVPWHTSDVAPGVPAWLTRMRAAGFRFCLVTNNLGARVREVAHELNVPLVVGALKPLPLAFVLAARELKAARSQTLVVGDQLFTDVLGAKLLGMRVIVVKPVAKREYLSTKMLRILEARIYAKLGRVDMIAD